MSSPRAEAKAGRTNIHWSKTKAGNYIFFYCKKNHFFVYLSVFYQEPNLLVRLNIRYDLYI